MTPRDALVQVVQSAKNFRYDRNTAAQISQGLPVPWALPDQVEHEHKAICSGFSLWAIDRAWTLCDGVGDFFLIGGTRGGGFHAWVAAAEGAIVELLLRDVPLPPGIDDDLLAWWADPTPPAPAALGSLVGGGDANACVVARPSHFTDREPIEHLHWNGIGKRFDRHGKFS